jgi:hypothetical protein
VHRHGDDEHGKHAHAYEEEEPWIDACEDSKPNDP